MSELRADVCEAHDWPAHFVTAVDAYVETDDAVAAAERALRLARRVRSRARTQMHDAAPPELDNARPGYAYPDVIEWRRRVSSVAGG